ncbi:archaellin/type IV pilin N-terminal domain-containing protein [Haloglomus halophilum]|uniref:archaellin/type IV pilin N-terminal domain-containing protein n=1 Tax=Haloglomus halophilum TaxID=2962672 RepID=UPI0020CA036B|nr:archaellin/type IV pilin N-terminal domain-containing protein [Haloglomus halophilum]
MFDNINNTDEERGQVGIGTLIVFIALVLVAAIAAGVLINTAGFLQNQAESTGQESTNQVTQSLDVQNTLGTADGSGNIDTIELVVSKSPGAGPVNVTNSTIQYVSPDDATTLIGAEQSSAGFTTDSDILTDDSSPITITISLADLGVNNLQAGDEVEMTITTPSGGQSTVIATVPEPLTTDDDGDQVRL